jgi:predicted RND superfamily exporter protein
VLRDVDRMPAPSAAERRASVEELIDSLEALERDRVDADAFAATDRLRRVLQQLVAAGPESDQLVRFEELVLSDIDEQLDWLSRVISSEEVVFSELPEPLRERLVSKDGKVVLSVIPRNDVRDVKNLREFVDQVLAIDPNATGRPVVEAGIGTIVVDSFRFALALSFVVVSLVLFTSLRDPTEALLVLSPIVLAALLTVASGILLGLKFNMSNVVAIPLVLGLGVDNGIHIVMRHREGGGIRAVLRSSTPRAILLSGLTTLGAFGGLSVSSHGGIHSLGVLLSLAMFYLMLCTLLVLPALLAWRHGEELDPMLGID